MTIAWEQAFQENRHAVLAGWSAGAAGLLSAGAVPSQVAGALEAELGRLVDALAAGTEVDEPLFRLTRILAVQEIPPSKALSFFFNVPPFPGDLPSEARDRFRDRIDALVLQAFDSYMKHRETIYQLKLDEGRRRMHMALRRAEA